MTKQLTLISPETYLSSTWSGGRTTQLCLLPAGASYAERNFDLRISSATVEIEESVFSDLRGYSRIIAPLEGSFDLQHPDRKGLQHFHLERYQLHAFDGGEKTLCRGRGRDFNVIFRHGLDVKVMRLDPGEEPLALDLSAAALAGAGATEADLAASGAKKIYLFFPEATSFEVEGDAGKAPALTLWQFDPEQSREKSQENTYDENLLWQESCEKNGEENGEEKMPRSLMLCSKLSAPAYLIMMLACKDE